MAQFDPFTLDLFGSSALSSGLGLDVTAFSPSFESIDAEYEPSSSQSDFLPVTASAPAKAEQVRGNNFHLAGTRGLAKSWRDRARDNLAAIHLATEIDAERRPATADEQARLIRFTGFGASELANGIFRCPGEEGFRKGWEEIGTELEITVANGDYASLQRCTQYAHFTPEYIARAVWDGVARFGFRSGRVLEPGIGTGLFPALMPQHLRDLCHVTGIELDPLTARIAKLLQPRARR